MAGVFNFLPAQCLHIHAASRAPPQEGAVLGHPPRSSDLRVQFRSSSASSLSTVVVPSSFNPSKWGMKKLHASLSPKASVGSAEVAIEPATNVQFEKSLVVPGCSSPLILLGTGFREKVFAIIGVKVYAAGFYVDPSLAIKLSPWGGKSADELSKDSSLFKSIFEEPSPKSLLIVLVRDVDGDTFWSALNDAISPRVKSPTPADESALSTFRNVFLGRPLIKGSGILLTWAEPSKMLISVSSEGTPTATSADIESINVTKALFDAFFGNSPVSPTLKASSAGGVEMFLK